MAAQHIPEPPSGADAPPAPDGTDASTPTTGSRGIRAVVLGGVVMVLAPLFGFLGGSMAGGTGAPGTPDPLAVWLLGGMVVGGAGGIVAILGLLRWMRSTAQARTGTDRP